MVMMAWRLQIIQVIFILSAFGGDVLTQCSLDTVPPVFDVPPQDISVQCNSDIIGHLNDWLMDHAAAVADSGTASILILQSANVIEDALEEALDNGCSGTGSVDVGYYAQDTCGNFSIDTINATFTVLDNQKPVFTTQAQDLSLNCHYGILDSLQNWVDSHGNAVAVDNCSDTLSWTTYIWNDNLGNSGFGTFGQPTNIIIQRSVCSWFVTVSFFVVDECDNANVTTSVFSIESDTFPPGLVSGPPDMTISCDSIPALVHAVFEDGCDGILAYEFNETSDRAASDTLCGYYNHTILRTWQATDACGNSTEFTQNITVEDITQPTVEFETVLALDCSANQEDHTNFLTTADDCSAVIIEFVDHAIIETSCQKQFNRIWTITDVCENKTVVQQTVQVQDFFGPSVTMPAQNMIVPCDTPGLFDTLFNAWVSRFADVVFEDNCNGFNVYARVPGSYTDSTSLVNGQTATFTFTPCNDTTSGALMEQIVDFVALDSCGNLSTSKARFIVEDTQPPVVSNCPADQVIILAPEECSHAITFVSLPTTDNCNALQEQVLAINNNEVFNLTNTSFDIELDAGIYDILYTVTDCAGNSDVCTHVIEVQDTVKPVVVCPGDTIISIDNNCSLDYTFQLPTSFVENCKMPVSYDRSIPQNEGYLSFSLNQSTGFYRLDSKTLRFEDIDIRGEVYGPVVHLEYRVNVSVGASWNVISEDGQVLLNIGSDTTCLVRNQTIHLEAEDVQGWASDGSVAFTFVPDHGAGPGVGACKPENINGNQGPDNSSFLKARMTFSDIRPSGYAVNSAIDTVFFGSNDEMIRLKNGDYQVVYVYEDLAGNTGGCTYDIVVEDNDPPMITCVDRSIIIDVESLGIHMITESDLGLFVTDNCSIDSVSISPRELDCDDLGKIIPITTTVTDDDGNSSSCLSNIDVKAGLLSPSFLSGLCFADTLRLFSNIEDTVAILSYEWSGPNNYTSAVRDPVLTNINTTFSGNYTLTVTGVNGCTASGSISIEISQITSPEITSPETEICAGENVLLNSISFIEDVTYLWYEGISPNGVLIGSTSGPSFQLKPVVGTHNYYVQVEGEGCQSNPSNTIEIMVIDPPIAQIGNPFVSVCEGEGIILFASEFNPDFSYQWFGPGGYTSTGQFPMIIGDAQPENQGTYSLVISNQFCSSDTALAQVIVFPKPPLPIIDGENVFCEGVSAVLTVSNIPNGSKYHWYQDGDFYTTVSTNTLLIPAVSTAISGNWTVVVEDGICESDTSSAFQIVVENILNIGAANNGPICEGDSVELTSTFIPNATYRWEDPDGLVREGRIIRMPAKNGFYTITITTESNCSATATTRVEVTAKPRITALSNTSLPCVTGASPVRFVPTVFPPGDYIYVWSGPGGFTSSVQNPVISNVDESDNGTYTLVVLNEDCPSAPASTIVNVNIIPTAPFIVAPDQPCAGESFTLEVFSPHDNIDAYLWRTPLGDVITADNFLQIDDFSSANQGYYAVVLRDGSCLSPESDSVFIDFMNNPAQPVIQAESFYCENGSIMLHANQYFDADYHWITPGGEVVTGSNQLVIDNAGPNDQGDYRLFVVVNNCSSSLSDHKTLEMLPSPDPPIFIGSDLSVCIDDVTSIEICVMPSASPDIVAYNLFDVTGTIIDEQSQTACFAIDDLTPFVNQEVELFASVSTDECASVGPASIHLEVNERSEERAEVNADVILVCDQDFVSLSADVIPDFTDLEWIAPNPVISVFNATSVTASFSNLPEGENIIILKTHAGACRNLGADTVLVSVVRKLEAADDMVNLDFNAEGRFDVVQNDNVKGDVQLQIVQTSAPFDPKVEQSHIVIPANTGFVGTAFIEYEICYVDCPEICDRAVLEVEVAAGLDCFVGNVLTPNNDGYNDALLIPCLDTGNYPGNSLQVFNQAGDAVFSAKPYRNDWLGDYNGKTLPPGTYFYVFNPGDGSQPLSGFIVLEL